MQRIREQADREAEKQVAAMLGSGVAQAKPHESPEPSLQEQAGSVDLQSEAEAIKLRAAKNEVELSRRQKVEADRHARELRHRLEARKARKLQLLQEKQAQEQAESMRRMTNELLEDASRQQLQQEVAAIRRVQEASGMPHGLDAGTPTGDATAAGAIRTIVIQRHGKELQQLLEEQAEILEERLRMCRLELDSELADKIDQLSMQLGHRQPSGSEQAHIGELRREAEAVRASRCTEVEKRLKAEFGVEQAALRSR